MSRGKAWSAEEIGVIQAGVAEGMSHKAIAARLPHRSLTAVSLRASVLGSHKVGRPVREWDSQRVQEAADAVRTMGLEAAAAHLGKTPECIRTALRRHGQYAPKHVRREVKPRARGIWTAERLAQARALVAVHGLKEAAVLMGKRPETLRAALRRNGGLP